MNAVPEVLATSPGSSSDLEIADFVALVRAGGEVESRNLEERVRAAERISFLRNGKCLLGVAGLKRPSKNHRAEISAGSGVSLTAADFPVELGWVFVLPSARGRRLSFPLCKPLVEAAQGRGVFATSTTGNGNMHGTLTRLGFVPAGTAYKSTRGNYQLQLFLRHKTGG